MGLNGANAKCDSNDVNVGLNKENQNSQTRAQTKSEPRTRHKKGGEAVERHTRACQVFIFGDVYYLWCEHRHSESSFRYKC